MAVRLDSVMVNHPRKRANKDVRVTKDGNPYYHTNTCKKVGTGIGVVATIIGAVGMFAATKNVKSLAALIPSAITAIGKGFIGGAIIDGLVNHHQKKKADAMASFNAKV